MRAHFLLPALVLAIAGFSYARTAAAAEHFEAGTLTCDLSGDIGAILGAKQDASLRP